jgi:hypothetical protein
MTQSDETVRVEWRNYDRLAPGEYLGYCAFAQIYFDGSYKRHTCLLVWNLLSDDGENIGTVRCWLNLGNKKAPSASRRSRYWAEWVQANEGRAPSRRDRLSPQIFKNRLARLLVSDTASSPPYSVVSRILCWETGSPAGGVKRPLKPQSFNNSSRQRASPSPARASGAGR